MHKKYFSKVLNFLPLYLLFPFFFWVTTQLVGWFYPPLSELLPSMFPTYNKIYEREAYELLEMGKTFFSAVLTLALMNLLSVLYDGRRYEDTVSKTDGLFRIHKELIPYYERNLIPDIIASALIQIPFLIATKIPFPKEALRFTEPLLRPHAVIIEPYGVIAAYFIILAVSALTRLLCAPLVLKRHRAMWITAFAEESEL